MFIIDPYNEDEPAIIHDTAANWTAGNRVLQPGQMGVETDTGKFKLGDGVTAWTSLVYATYTIAELTALLADKLGIQKFITSDAYSPSDGQTVYIGPYYGVAAQTTTGNSKFGFHRAGTISYALIEVRAGGPGSPEDTTISLRENNTTDHLLGNTIKYNAASSVYLFPVSIAVTTSVTYETKIAHPTYSTNPTATITAVTLIGR